MSKQADKQWGEMWSREKEMECQVALQTLAGIKADTAESEE